MSEIKITKESLDAFKREVEKRKTREIFVRLGVMLEVTPSEGNRILRGDNELFAKIVRDGRFHLGGDSYIPDCSIDDYNSMYGKNYELRDIEICF